MQQLAAQDSQPAGPSHSTSTGNGDHQHVIHSLQSKVKHLEKDLYYYKKTSRDLKRKLQGEIATSKNIHTSNQTLKHSPENNQKTPCVSTAVSEHELSHTTSLLEQLDKPQDSGTLLLAHQTIHTQSVGARSSAMDEKVESTSVKTSSVETHENLEDSLDAGVGTGSGRGDNAKDKASVITRKHKKQLRQLRYVC